MAIKSDSVTYQTSKTITELADAIRGAAAQVKADDMQRISIDDPLGGVGVIEPELAVALSGRLGFFGAMKSFTGGWRDIWVVQIYVYDQGGERIVELASIGETLWAQGLGQYAKQQTIDRKTSRMKRDELARLILGY